MKIKNLELVKRIIQVITIIICAVITPLFLFFLVYPNVLIPGYSSYLYGSLYIIYTVVFIFLLSLTIGINAIVKRYIKRSIEEIVNIQQQTTQPIAQYSTNKNEKNLKFCLHCGAEILDKTRDFCSECGAPLN